jgi:hypothetical protein
MSCRHFSAICLTVAVIATGLNAQALNPEENAIKQRLIEYYEHRSKGDAILPTFFHEDVDMRLSSTAITIQNGRAAVLERFRSAVGQPPPRLQIQKTTFLTDTLALVDATLETDVNGGTTSYSFYVMVKQGGVWRFRAMRSYQLPTPK